MSQTVAVRVHSSQFPENVRRDLLQSLRTRSINHKFHYDTIKQTHQWLALHEAYSPSRTDDNCTATYEKSFVAAAQHIRAQKIHLIGLGCGGGQKDLQLLKLLRRQKKEFFYTPTDVGVPMVLVAQRVAGEIIPADRCFPFVCDLASPENLSEMFSNKVPDSAQRLVTFFGMIPNFEPQFILPKLAALLRKKDWLLFSANLAPGKKYSAGVKKILPLYDNELTRDWLMTFLTDLGVDKRDGALKFSVQKRAAGDLPLQRIAAHFNFSRRCVIQAYGEQFEFRAGEKIQLFFSYRHTPNGIAQLLSEQGMKVVDQWVTNSGEEGVFLCQKSA